MPDAWYEKWKSMVTVKENPKAAVGLKWWWTYKRLRPLQ